MQKGLYYLHSIFKMQGKEWGLAKSLSGKKVEERERSIGTIHQATRSLNNPGYQLGWYIADFNEKEPFNKAAVLMATDHKLSEHTCNWDTWLKAIHHRSALMTRLISKHSLNLIICSCAWGKLWRVSYI